MYSLKYPRVWLASGYALAALIISLSLLPDLPGPKTVGFDKAGHIIMYASLAFWFCGIYKPSHWPAVLILLIALGGMLELLQSLTSHRSAEWPDMAANLAGAGVGLLLGWKILPGWCGRVERWLGLQSTESGRDA